MACVSFYRQWLAVPGLWLQRPTPREQRKRLGGWEPHTYICDWWDDTCGDGWEEAQRYRRRVGLVRT